jgi:hypothetical protein
MEDVSLQVNHICKDTAGNDYLIHRNLDVLKITDLIQDALVGDFSKIAKRALPPDYLLRFPKEGPQSLLREITGHLPGKVNHITEDAKNYHIFITCEDPGKAEKRFVRRVRIFLLQEDHVEKLADPDFVETLKTERDIYSQRVRTLHAICKKMKAGELKYGEEYCTCELRVKTRDYTPRDKDAVK